MVGEGCMGEVCRVNGPPQHMHEHNGPYLDDAVTLLLIHLLDVVL